MRSSPWLGSPKLSSRIAVHSMLWTVRHRCPKASRFAFNCYRHEVRLVLRRPGKDAIFLLSLEGVTQGDPLAMALFGIVVCPLADILRREFPSVLQPWYADGAAMMGVPADVAACFRRLQELGPHFDFHPLPSKSWCICSAAAEPPSRDAFAALSLGAVKWRRY